MINNSNTTTNDLTNNSNAEEIEDKFRTILKALDLLGCDLLDDVSDTMTHKYFEGRINYLFGVAVTRNIDLITHSYIRSLYTLFSNYYLTYRSPLPGEVVSASDKERNFIYSEINGRLEDFQMEH